MQNNLLRGARKEKVDATGETWIAMADDGLARTLNSKRP
jgi:hypothetical protein